MLIINDENAHEHGAGQEAILAEGERRLLSLLPSPFPRGAQPGAVRWKDSGIDAGYGAGVAIPKNDRIEMLKEREAQQSRIIDRIDFLAWDQNGLPYCWNNAGTQAASTFRRLQGLPFIHISAASVGAIAANYRVRGGYGGETLKVLRERGGVDAKDWPNNAVDRSLDTPQTQENRKHHMVTSFVECEDWDEQATAMLLNFPTSLDYNWWSHVVMGAFLGLRDGEETQGIRNSWKDTWGSKNRLGFGGFAELQGSKRIASYCFAIVQMTASEL